MQEDGPRAAKFVYSLVLIALSVALALTLRSEARPQDNGVERRVMDRARPMLLNAAGRARAEGDERLAARLEELLRGLEAQQDSRDRRNAGH